MICIGSTYEHDAVDRWLNIRVSNLEELEKALQDNLSDTKFVFWLGVSNITGEIFPVIDIGNVCHKYDAFYICDMTAMIGKVPIPTDIDQWCDCAVWSGHKLGTELGIGAMWLSQDFDKWLGGFKPHGTPNLAGVLAITQAVKNACDSKALEDKNNHWLKLFWEMVEGFQKAHIHGGVYNNVLNEEKSDANEPAETTCAINAIHLPGINADALQQYLASKQIYVSIGGSACAESRDYRVLNAYGLSNDEASEVIRISFGENSSVEDVEALVEGIVEFKNLFI